MYSNSIYNILFAGGLHQVLILGKKSETRVAHEVKCVILGPAAAGKSALVAQYCDETFVPTYLQLGSVCGEAWNFSQPVGYSRK